ncbi:MAG: cytochrome c maturation protein CcmE [bacterium]|nr:cytochrome c maturation protein CcmE [bacterium]
MKPKYRRLCLILAALAVMGSGVALALVTLRNEVIFFVTPSELLDPSKDHSKESSLRLGGYVQTDSVTLDGLKVKFQVTDFEASLWVAYEGVLPDLFRDGQGVIVEGHLLPSGIFKAHLVMAKHDEKYKPPELEQLRQKAGHS